MTQDFLSLYDEGPAQPRRDAFSWIFALRDLWELFTISGFDPSPHRNMCHCARFRWVLDCNSEPCCPGGSRCPCSLELKVPFRASPVPTGVHEVSDQRKETEPEATLSPRLYLLGLGSTVISKGFLAYITEVSFLEMEFSDQV